MPRSRRPEPRPTTPGDEQSTGQVDQTRAASASRGKRATTRDEIVEVAGGLQLRQLRDPRAMRALAHPRRMELLELLHIRGPQTATQCAEALGDSPAGCSYHLRQLARFGFVEEADGGTGRERPWQVARIGLRLDPITEDDSPAQRAAQELLEQVIGDRRLAWLERWHRQSPTAAAAWRRVAVDSDFGFYATPDELAALSDQLHELLGGYQARALARTEPPAPGSEFVTLLLYAFPRLPESYGNGPADTPTPRPTEPRTGDPDA